MLRLSRMLRLSKEQEIKVLTIVTMLCGVASLTLSGFSLYFAYLSWTQRHPHASEPPQP